MWRNRNRFLTNVEDCRLNKYPPRRDKKNTRVGQKISGIKYKCKKIYDFWEQNCFINKNPAIAYFLHKPVAPNPISKCCSCNPYFGWVMVEPNARTNNSLKFFNLVLKLEYYNNMCIIVLVIIVITYLLERL